MVFSFDPSLLRLQSMLDRFAHAPSTGFAAGLGPGSAPGYEGSAADAGVFPAINVFTDGDELVVRAEVPGVQPDDLEITSEQGRLLISGERKNEPRAAGEGAYHRRERPVGRFARAIRLPDDLDAGAATATCRNGMLTVRVPRSEHAKPRKINIGK